MNSTTINMINNINPMFFKGFIVFVIVASLFILIKGYLEVDGFKKTITKLIRFYLVLIIIGSASVLGKRLYDYQTNKKNTKIVDNIVKEVEEESKNAINENGEKEDSFVEKEKKYMETLKRVRAINKDAIGFIEIPGTWVNYPILQGPDNDYYLDKGLTKEYDIGGSIFIDTGNSNNFTDDNTVIYGHHMYIDSMFTALDNFKDQNFAENNRKIYITTLDGLKEYQVFSAYGAPSTYNYRVLRFGNKNDKPEYFNELKSKSEVSLNTRPFASGDKIITLSTCAYDYDDQRFVVQAMLVRE